VSGMSGTPAEPEGFDPRGRALALGLALVAELARAGLRPEAVRAVAGAVAGAARGG
jgi:hypothetical protein